MLNSKCLSIASGNINCLCPLWKRIYEVLSKMKINYHIIQKFNFWVFIWRTQNAKWKRFMHYHVYCNTVYNSQDIEITYVSTGRKSIMLVRWKKMLLYDLNYMWCLQTNPNTYKKASSWIQRTDRRLPEVRAGELGSGRYCEDSQKVQTSS